jgi:hypothetical protein
MGDKLMFFIHYIALLAGSILLVEGGRAFQRNMDAGKDSYRPWILITSGIMVLAVIFASTLTKP